MLRVVSTIADFYQRHIVIKDIKRLQLAMFHSVD